MPYANNERRRERDKRWREEFERERLMSLAVVDAVREFLGLRPIETCTLSRAVTKAWKEGKYDD